MLPTHSTLRWNVLCLPKHGNAEDEYEDAWAADPARGRFAVADGASETSFAGRWAQLLTDGYLEAARSSAVEEWLPAPRRRWAAEVMGLELPWYAEMKREQGAFATFLGVQVRRPSADRPARWRAVAVGDSCLIRAEKRTIPIVSVGSIGGLRQPAAADRLARRAGDRTRVRVGALLPGDLLLLLTDALAQWFLQAQEQGGRPAEAIETLLSADRPDEAFAEWVEEQRGRGDLRNDDVTLLAVESTARAEKEDVP